MLDQGSLTASTADDTTKRVVNVDLLKVYVMRSNLVAAGLSLVLVPSLAHAGLLNANLLSNRQGGGTRVAVLEFSEVTGFPEFPDIASHSLSAGAPSHFGGFSYDPTSNLAFYLSGRGDGGTRIAVQPYTEMEGFLDDVIYSHSLSSGAPPEFGGFSYDPATSLAMYLSGRVGGGTRVAVQPFDPVLGFLGDVVASHSLSSKAPSAFGGFSYDPQTGLSYLLSSRVGGGTRIAVQKFDPLDGFEEGVLASLNLSSSKEPSEFGGFSYLTIPEPSSIAISVIACVAFCFYSCRRYSQYQ